MGGLSRGGDRLGRLRCPPLDGEESGGVGNRLERRDVAGAECGVNRDGQPLALGNERLAVIPGAAGGGAEAAFPSELGDLGALGALDDV